MLVSVPSLKVCSHPNHQHARKDAPSGRHRPVTLTHLCSAQPGQLYVATLKQRFPVQARSNKRKQAEKFC